MIGPALGAWAGTALPIVFGWRAGAGASALAAASTIVSAVALARSQAVAALLPRWCLAALALFAVCVTMSSAHAREADGHPLARLAREAERAEVLVTVWTTDDPKPVRGNRVLIPAELRAPWGDGSVVVLGPRAQYETLAPWQEVTFRAKPSPPRRRDLTVASLTAVGPPQAVGPLSLAAKATGSVRREFAAVCERVLGEDEAKVLPAVVLGDSARVSGKLKDEFSDSGLTHLMVVSGANFAIVLGALLLALRAVGTDPRVAAVLAFAALVCLVLLVRPSPSVLRAAVMGALGLVALFVGRRRQTGHALGAAVVVLLAFDAALAVDYGFVLSVLATGALLWLAPRWREKLAAKKAPSVLAEAFAATAAAHVATLPVVAALTGKVSVVGLAANLLVEPVVGLMTVLGCLGVAASAVWGPGGELITRFAGVPTTWLVAVAKGAAACPYGVIHTGPGLWGFTMAFGITSGMAAMAVAVVWLRAHIMPLPQGGSPHGCSRVQTRSASASWADLRRTVRREEPHERPGPRRGHDP